MSTCVARLIYLKHLYINAAKEILSENFKVFNSRLNHWYIQKEYTTLQDKIKEGCCITYCDRHNCFFNFLAKKIISKKELNDKIIISVLSPFYNSELCVIDEIYIPEYSFSMINNYNYDDTFPCPGYIVDENDDLADYNFSIATEFLNKAEYI